MDEILLRAISATASPRVASGGQQTGGQLAMSMTRCRKETIKLVEEGKIDLTPFITQRIQLQDLVSQGFETLIQNNESAVKIIVQPRLK